ncbi:unnamed protein product [Brassica oleracea var. botrytis]
MDVTYPFQSFYPSISDIGYGETDEYMIFGRIWCYWIFYSDFYLGIE